MASDFSAKQIRVSQLMASGGISGTGAGLLIYSASDASDYTGGFPADLVASFGNDVFLFVSGTKDGRSTGAGDVTLFGGDVVVSGTLYAEKQVVEVNESTTGSFSVSGSFFVSQSATINQGLVVNESAGIHADDDFRVETGNKTHAVFVDASTDQVLILSGGGGTSTDEAGFSDTSFFVSGTVGSRGTAVKGTALFGGDLHISGAITSDGTALVDGTGAANRVAYWSDTDTLTSDTGFTWDGSTFTANGAMVIDTSTLVVDSSTNRVGIGTASPDGSLHVQVSSAGTVTVTGDQANGIIIEDDDSTAITLLDPSGGVIYFGDADDTDIGRIGYRHSGDYANSMYFYTNNAQQMTIDSAGNVGIGTNSPSGILDVKGDGSTSQIFLLSGSGAAADPNEAAYADMALFVSGAIGSRGTTTKGTAIFGGDTVISGALYLDEVPAPGTIPDGTIAVYGKDDSGVTKLYFKNESGEVELGVDGAPGGSDTQLQYNNSTAFGGISGATTDGTAVTFSDTGILVGQYITHDGDPDTQIRFETDEIRLETGGVDYIKTKASETAITLNPDNAVINTLIYSQNKTGIAVAGATDQVLILSGGGVTSYDEAAAADVNFYVSGTVGSAGTAIRGTSVFGGDVIISGSLFGGSPLVVGDGIDVTGDVTIAEYIKHTGDTDTLIRFQDDSITLTAGNENLLTITESTQDTVAIGDGGDVDFQVKTSGATNTLFVEGSSDRVGIGTSTPHELLDVRGNVASTGYVSASMGLSGSLTRLVDGTSYLAAGSNVTITSASNGQVTINSTAGGTVDGSGAATRIAYWSDADTLTSDADLIFDGDTLTAANSSNTAIPAITIDRNYTGTTSIGNFTTDPQGLLIDYDVTGIVADGETAIHDAIAINYNQDSPTMVGTINATGADIRMTGGTSGTQTMKGVAITLAGADDSIGVDITAPNDSSHFIARSSDHILDHFQISVGADGATTLSTSDYHATAADLTLDADGKIIIEAAAGDETVFNEGGLDVDFRVESSGEDEAIFLNAGSGKLHFNKGKSAFTTTIWSNNDNALEVNSSGVTLNELGNTANDFRVETSTKEYGLFVDAGADQVLILSGGAVGSTDESDYADLAFFVSGTVGSRGTTVKGTALFGGDLHVSGNLTVDGTSPGGGTPGGSDTQVQYNNGGSFGGVADLTFNDSTGDVTVGTSTGDAKLFFRDAGNYIYSNADGDFDIINTDGTAANSILIDCNAGGVTIDGHTGVTLVAPAGAVDIDADSGTLSLDGSAGINIGTGGAVAVDFNADTLDIDALLAVTIDSAGGTIGIGTDDNDFNISIGTQGGRVIALGSSDAGIDIDAGASGVDIDSGTGGFDVLTTGELALSSSMNSPVAIQMLASAGGIRIEAEGGGAGEIIDINCNTGAVYINSGDTVDGLSLGGGTSGVPITIGHTVSETTVQDNLNVTGNLLPSADVTSDLGSETKRWQNIYTGDLHLANERGDWSVIEESDYLTLRNNKSGKRYKLLMELLPGEGEE